MQVHRTTTALSGAAINLYVVYKIAFGHTNERNGEMNDEYFANRSSNKRAPR
jgi:hypothetical protein